MRPMNRTTKVLAGLILTGVCAVTVQAGSEKPPLADQRINDAAERELISDHAVPWNDLDVSTAEGIVTLRGMVDCLLARERAVRIVETVKGVRSVVNLVQVRRFDGLSDEQLKRSVERALLTDPATDSYEVSVTVKDGAVTLGGSVDSWHERNLTETVAMGVKGVVGITNDLELNHVSERPDHEIEFDIEQALHWNHLVDDALIVVDAKDGRVVLSGIIGSAAEKRLAHRDAWTRGVNSVDLTGLEVKRWARDEDLRKGKYVTKSDGEIRTAVQRSFAHDPRVSPFDVDLSVADGVVTLRGVVDSLKARRAAEQDASNTVGVISVRNHLRVRPGDERSDEAIAGDVREALLRDPFVDRFEIAVNVHGGTAYLSGTVDSYFEKLQADDLASRVAGIKGVENNLRVNDVNAYAYDPWVDPWTARYYDWYEYEPTYTLKDDLEIKKSIEEELWWSPFVDANDVSVSVEDGVATLTGTVDSLMEKGAARDNAYEAGALLVRNRLQVN